MLVKVFPERFSQRGKPYPGYGQYYRIGWDRRLNKKERSVISLYFLNVGSMSLATSAACHHAFPIMMDHTFTPQAEINPSFLKLLLSGVFVTAMRKVTNRVR